MITLLNMQNILFVPSGCILVLNRRDCLRHLILLATVGSKNCMHFIYYSANHNVLVAIHKRHRKSPKLYLHSPLSALSPHCLNAPVCRHSFDNLQKVTWATAIPVQGFLVTKHTLQMLHAKYKSYWCAYPLSF